MFYPLVAIVGETGVGKSALAVTLAEQFNGEIICADSLTIYHDFNIGTAKPNLNDQQRVPHHLLNIADPAEGFSAAAFQRAAYQAIDDIQKQRKLPFLVGGSGLYIDSVLFDYEFAGATNLKQRQWLNSLNLDDLWREMRRLGLDSQSIDMNNKRRVIRLIETNGRRPRNRLQRPDSLIIGLKQSPNRARAVLSERFDSMLAAGLEHEVSNLVSKYGWEAPPMQAVGYKEWRDYFNHHISLVEVRYKVIQNSLLLARKQRTWFRRNKSIHWLSNTDKIEKYVDLITTFLNN